jgi:hypothetical protein
MGGILSIGGTMLGGLLGGGDDAGDASRDAAQIQADYQREALQYLKDTERLPQQFREGALTGLGDIYGLGAEGAQQKFFSGLESSPMYSAIMSGQDAGEEAILRNASATGGLRSGNTSYNLADFNTKLKNEALLSSYNNQVQGLQGLAGIQSMAPKIANATSGIGQTLGQGMVAGAQADQQSQQNMIGNLMGLGQLGMMAFSDVRLKDNIQKIGQIGKYSKYSWDWNEDAKAFGLSGSSEGVMAHEVEDDDPSLVSIVDGYKVVDYSRIH